MLHDNVGEAIKMPICMAGVWHIAEIEASLGYGNSKTRVNPGGSHKRLEDRNEYKERRPIQERRTHNVLQVLPIGEPP
jgi:hypothetical protein